MSLKTLSYYHGNQIGGFILSPLSVSDICPRRVEILHPFMIGTSKHYKVGGICVANWRLSSLEIWIVINGKQLTSNGSVNHTPPKLLFDNTSERISPIVRL